MTDQFEQAWTEGHEQGWNDCLHEWNQQTRIQIARRNRWSVPVAIASTTALVLMLFCLGLRWIGVTGTLTDSEPPGLYRTVAGTPQRGDMVELLRLTKHVAAVAGDTVTTTAQGVYVNGKLWPFSAVPKDCNYRPFPYGTYHLATGQWWVMGMNPWSYDSRFFGPIPSDLINSRVEPLWTVSNGYAAGSHPW